MSITHSCKPVKIIPRSDTKLKCKCTQLYTAYNTWFNSVYEYQSILKTTADYLKAMEKLDLEIFYNMAWVLAKAADNSIPPVLE